MDFSVGSIAFAIFSIFIFCKFLETLLRIPYISNVTDRYVLITGCDTGFGNLLAKRLDSRGVRVIAACLTEKGRSDLQKVTSERLTTLLMDVSDHNSIIDAYERVKEILPTESDLWGVVNNAGIGRWCGFLEWTRREDYEKIAGVNLFGAIDVSLTFLPLLKKSRGRLVQVVSVAGRVGLPVIAPGYCESKFGLEAFTDIARREFIRLGYQVTASIIEPGFFATNIIDPTNIVRDINSTWERLDDAEKTEFPSKAAQTRIDEAVSGSQMMATRDLQLVPAAMEHALLARWPKTRYSVGWDAKAIWIPTSYLPSIIGDRIMAHF